MLGTYEKMQKDMKIGPMEMGPNGIPRPKAYAEYPKLVQTGKVDAKGRPVKKLVTSAQEELRLRAFAEIEVPEDPRVKENNELAAQVAALQAELAELRAIKAGQKEADKPELKAEQVAPKPATVVTTPPLPGMK